jgi:multidrug efflux system outer membrane protein
MDMETAATANHSVMSVEKGTVMKHVMDALLKLAVVVAIIGCKVGPDYKRPAVNVPQAYRGGLAPDIATARTDASLSDEQWAAIFQDTTLKRLIEDALANNLDLRIAAQRVMQAQAQVGITRSQQLPTISGGGSYSALQIPSSMAGTNANGTPGTSFYDGGGVSASAAWNLDFWGMYRRQSEAARAELLAREWGRRAARTSLVQSVAQAYFNLRSLDAQLEITTSTIGARRDSLKLTQSLEQHGASSLADVRQAEELLHAAQANLPQLRSEIAAQENAISILLGHNPGPVGRGLSVAEQPHPQGIPVGVPSQLLERRPDVQQAEAKLVAANARIGVISCNLSLLAEAPIGMRLVRSRSRSLMPGAFAITIVYRRRRKRRWCLSIRRQFSMR